MIVVRMRGGNTRDDALCSQLELSGLSCSRSLVLWLDQIKRSLKELLSLRGDPQRECPGELRWLFLVPNSIIVFQVWHFETKVIHVVFMIFCPSLKILPVICDLRGLLENPREQLNGWPFYCKAPGSWWHGRCRSRSSPWHSTESWEPNITVML